MTKRKHEIIPKIKSSFIKVRCPNCSNEQITFDHAKIIVRCKNCNAILLEVTGGKAKLKGKLIAKYG